MNRAMIIGGMGIMFLGLGLVGTNLLPTGFLAKADSVPSLGQLIEKSSLLDRKSARITSRLALKQELMQLWRSGVIEIAEMFDNWVWLNSHEPLHAPAINIMYPGLSPRQIAMLQVLTEMEESTHNHVSLEQLMIAKTELSIAREAVISGAFLNGRPN